MKLLIKDFIEELKSSRLTFYWSESNDEIKYSRICPGDCFTFITNVDSTFTLVSQLDPEFKISLIEDNLKQLMLTGRTTSIFKDHIETVILENNGQ